MDCNANRTQSIHNRPSRLTGPTAHPAASAVVRAICQVISFRSFRRPSTGLQYLQRSMAVETYGYPLRMASYSHGQSEAQFSHLSERHGSAPRSLPPIRDRDAPLDFARGRLLSWLHPASCRARPDRGRHWRRCAAGGPTNPRCAGSDRVRPLHSPRNLVCCRTSHAFVACRGNSPQNRTRAADRGRRPHVRVPGCAQPTCQACPQIPPDTPFGRHRPGLLASAPLCRHDARDLPGIWPARGARQPRLRRKRRESPRDLWRQCRGHLAVRPIHGALLRDANHRVPRRTPRPGEVHPRGRRASQVSLRAFPGVAARPGGLQRRRNRRPARHRPAEDPRFLETAPA